MNNTRAHKQVVLLLYLTFVGFIIYTKFFSFGLLVAATSAYLVYRVSRKIKRENELNKEEKKSIYVFSNIVIVIFSIFAVIFFLFPYPPDKIRIVCTGIALFISFSNHITQRSFLSDETSN